MLRPPGGPGPPSPFPRLAMLEGLGWSQGVRVQSLHAGCRLLWEVTAAAGPVACAPIIPLLFHLSRTCLLHWGLVSIGEFRVASPSGGLPRERDSEQMGKGLHELLGPLGRSPPKPGDIWKAPGGMEMAHRWRWGRLSLKSMMWGPPAGHQDPESPRPGWEQGRGCFAEDAVGPLSMPTPFLCIQVVGWGRPDLVPGITGLQSVLQTGFQEHLAGWLRARPRLGVAAAGPGPPVG